MPDDNALAAVTAVPSDRNQVALTGSRRSLFLVLSGPGGTGKTLLARRWLTDDSSLGYARNVTTRAPRRPDAASGVDDRDWFDFVSPERFRELVEAQHFVQWTYVTTGYCSGTPVAPLHAAIDARTDLLFDYTPQLYLNLRRAFPEQTVGVFVVPPSLAVLRERLASRGAGPGQAEDLKYRMALQDLSYVDEHDYFVVNDDIDETLARLAAIRTAEQVRLSRIDGAVNACRSVASPSMLFYYDPFGARLDAISKP